MFWLTIAALAVVGLVAVLTLPRRARPGGFRDWLRNPHRFYEMVARSAADREVAVPSNPTAAEIQAQIEKLLHAQEVRRASAWLRKAGPPAVPALCAALNDARFRPSADSLARLRRGAAFDEILETLGQIGSADAVDTLGPLVRDENKQTRKHAALALGSIGHPSCCSPLRAALADDDEYVRSYAVMGIGRALDSGRAADQFLSGVFDALVPLLERDGHDHHGSLARTLLRMDRPRALPVVLEKRLFRAENPYVVSLLRALKAEHVPVPIETLLALATEFESHPNDYVREYGTAAILPALVDSGAPGVEEKARAALNSPLTQVAERAADVLAELRGVTNPYEVVAAREESGGWMSLTEVQKHYAAVSSLDAEINNGGYSQYFFNSYAEHWRDALAGLNAIGATSAARLFERALAIFGPAGPATDRESRQAQLSALIDRHGETLDALGSEYYKSEERLHVKLMLYVADHAEDFTMRKMMPT